MNKQELIHAVADRTGRTHKECELILNAALDTIGDVLAIDDKVKILGFGSFEVRKHAARAARNPRTNEVIHIPEYRSPLFKAGKNLKEKLY